MEECLWTAVFVFESLGVVGRLGHACKLCKERCILPRKPDTLKQPCSTQRPKSEHLVVAIQSDYITSKIARSVLGDVAH
eukprot:647503-Amphidinium_carterae.1